MSETTTEIPEESQVGGEDVEGIDATDEAPTSAIVLRSRSGKGSLTIDPNQEDWTPHQVATLDSIGIPVAGENAVPKPHIMQFMHMCQVADLDPFMREAYLIVHGKRFVRERTNEVVDNRKFTLVTGIDGFRKKAEDTGEYRGQVGPEWLTESGQWVDHWLPIYGKHPIAARVGIMRAGFDAPVYGVAMYDEFVAEVDQYEGYGRNRQKVGRGPNTMWAQMPANQLAKCSEAQALRKAFPRQMRGMYEATEMNRAQEQYRDQQRDEKRRAIARAHQERTATEPTKVGDTAAEVVEEARNPSQGAQNDPPESSSEPQATSPEQTHALLLSELRWQGEVMGHAPEVLARRAMAAAKVDTVEALPLQSLGNAVVAMRGPVADRLAKSNRESDAQVYGNYVNRQVPLDVAVLLGTVTGGADDDVVDAEVVEEAEVDPAEPHRHADRGDGECKHCASPPDAPWHL